MYTETPELVLFNF